MPTVNQPYPGMLPHGKAGDINLPPDWEKYVADLSKFTTLENGDSVMDAHYGESMTTTTVPPRSHPGKDDPDGHTEFFYLSVGTRSKAFNHPGFPKPINTPKVPKYEVREAPGKGRGVYATCEMYPGDLIWAERPLIVSTSVVVLPKGFRVGEHHTPGQNRALQLYAGERIHEAIVDRLTPEQKARFMSLANSHKEDGSGPCLGIVRTNQLGIGMVEGPPGPNAKTDTLQYTATGYVLSLMNHSCIANIKCTFDFASFSLKTYSRGHIKKGDELVWSYIAPDLISAEQRQEALSPYGFKCTCRLCLADEETNTFWLSFTPRSYILANFVFTSLLEEDFNNPFRNKSPAEQQARLEYYHDKINKLESLQRESSFYGHWAEPHLLCLGHELYKRVGNETKRQRYANLVVRWMKLYKMEYRPWI